MLMVREAGLFILTECEKDEDGWMERHEWWKWKCGKTEGEDYCSSARDILVNSESEREIRVRNIIMRDTLYN